MQASETVVQVRVRAHMGVCLLSFIGKKKKKQHSAIPWLTSLMFHVLTCCLIFKIILKIAATPGG